MKTNFATNQRDGVVIADGFQTVDGLKLSKSTLEKKPIFVATRCSCNHTGTTLAGTTAGVTYRYAHVMKTACTSLQFIFANFYPTATTESSNANDIIIAVTLEYNGQVSRLFFNGERQKTINQGGLAITDPILRNIPEGATFYTRTWVSVPTDGGTYPQGMQLQQTLGDGKGTGDLTLTAGTLPASTEIGFGPAAIVGVPKRDDAVAFALIGDSIVANALGTGWPVQLVEDNYGYSILSRPSSTVDSLEFNSANAYRMRLFKYATHAIMNYGTNDFNGTPPLTQMISHFELIWEALQAIGVRVYHSTTLPRTTSTDGWTTIQGQTPVTANSYNTKRATFNELLRAGAYDDMDITVLDVAAAIESGPSAAGVWLPNLTSDGIHPLQSGINAIVNSLTLDV